VRMYPEPTGEVRMSLSLRFAAGSHKGMIREGNEDSGYAGPRLLAIADGMGGAAAGEVASSEAISTIVALDDDVPGSDILTSLGTAVQRANDQLRGMVDEDPQLEGMGTTLTALLWTGQRLGLVHVGDSRAYLLRDAHLLRLTRDHTYVQMLLDRGLLSKEEAADFGARHVLVNALGGVSEDVEVDVSQLKLMDGDRVMLCSDGLTDLVDDESIRRVLIECHESSEACRRLVDLALAGGGKDNVTVVVATFTFT
jgi:PPM family protein phosphatase